MSDDKNQVSQSGVSVPMDTLLSDRVMLPTENIQLPVVADAEQVCGVAL